MPIININMFIFFLIFVTFYSLYYYFSYQIILLNDLDQIFSQTAVKAQEDLKQYSDLVLEDLSNCYVHVLLIILATTAISFLWILLLKYNAKLIIWLSIFALPIILSIGLYFSISTYISLKTDANNGLLSDDSNELVPGVISGVGDNNNNNEQTLAFDKALQTILTAELMSYIRNETLWLVISIVLFIILTALFIILHTLRQRVSLSIALIRQASKAINGVKSTLLFPIFPRTCGIAVLIYGVLISLLIISASHPAYHIVGGPNNGLSCHPKSFNRTTTIPPPRTRLSSPNSNPPRASISSSSSLSTASSQVLPPTTLALQLPGGSSAGVRFNGLTNVGRLPLQQQVRNNNSLLATGSTNGVKPKCVMLQRLSRQHVWKYHAINLFATLWLIHFISGISQTTLAGAFASYYWAYRKPKDVPYFAVTASFYRVFRHHLGDIAFGSFLIATIRYIRIVIEFIDNRIRKKNNPDVNNPTTRSVTCFFRIFFWLLDRFLKYIDRNAYIMMSMYGEGYLSSAKRAVELLYKNSTRALVLDYVTYFVLLVSRLLITGFAGFITAQEIFTANLHYKWLPIALVVIGTYFISKGLFSVYGMAVDTLFICFLIDSTNNDGSAERPYFMSKDLRRIMKRNTVMS